MRRKNKEGALGGDGDAQFTRSGSTAETTGGIRLHVEEGPPDLKVYEGGPAELDFPRVFAGPREEPASLRLAMADQFSGAEGRNARQRAFRVFNEGPELSVVRPPEGPKRWDR